MALFCGSFCLPARAACTLQQPLAQTQCARPYSFAELARITEEQARSLGAAAAPSASRLEELPPALLSTSIEGELVRGAAPRSSLAVLADVPPPERWLMVISGLFIAAFIARRRAKPVD